MDVFITTLVIIYIVLICISEFNIAYFSIITMIGMIFHKNKYPHAEDKLRFSIFVPCHNEGPVVESTVENYLNIIYSEELFDIYFIADNCTDNTADVLKEAIKKAGKKNFFVLERNDPDMNKRGKPHALKWGMDTLESQNQFYSKYDMFMILDADNFVDPTILSEINSQYLNFEPEKRPVMIQTYPDSKNNKGPIARGYFVQYRATTALLQNGKQFLHLVPGICGTGFVIDMNFLHELGGFNCKSLTEDLEIQCIATLKNRRIAYNTNVRIYDEKPTRLKPSLVQRTRWAQGHWYLAFRYIPRLFISMFKPKDFKFIFRKFDVITHLFVRFFCVVSSIVFVLGTGLSIYYLITLKTYSIPLMPIWLATLNTVFLVFQLISIPIASLIYGSTREKKRIPIDFIPNFLCLTLISIIDILVSWVGLFKCHNQKVWKKTAHNVTTIRKDRLEEIETANKKKDKRKKK